MSISQRKADFYTFNYFVYPEAKFAIRIEKKRRDRSVLHYFAVRKLLIDTPVFKDSTVLVKTDILILYKNNNIIITCILCRTLL